MLAFTQEVRRLLTWLIIALHALIGCVRAQQLVLCHRPDGHVTIAVAQEGGSQCECCHGPGVREPEREPDGREPEGGVPDSSLPEGREPGREPTPALIPDCCHRWDVPTLAACDESGTRARVKALCDRLTDIERSTPAIAVTAAPPTIQATSSASLTEQRRHRERYGPIPYLRTQVLRL